MWHISNLKWELKQILLSVSANTLKLAPKSPNIYESYIDLHKSCSRAHPNQMISYKHSILLHKMYNSYCPQMVFIKLNFNQILTSRQLLLNTIKSNNYQVGNNLLSSRLSILNLKIPPLILIFLKNHSKSNTRPNFFP